MRFVFSPPADEAAGLLTLPFGEPLEQWEDERLVEIRQRGLSRHVVRFVAEGGELYALKALSERLARREYRLLRALAELNVPAVEVVGIVVDRGPDLDAILVTRFLEYSTTYRALFSSPRVGQPTDRLLDALVELLVRLHLSGFFWGDCSLSNTLFRYDAGTLGAYLVDAETSEQHPVLTDGQRNWDVELAVERVSGELMDLQAGELLPADIDPLETGEEIQHRYEALWEELTREETLRPAGAAPSDRQAAAPAQRPRVRRRRAGADQHARTAASCGYGPRSPRRGSTARSCSGRPASAPTSIRPAGCSTTSPASAATWSRRATARCRRRSPRTAGSRRSTTRWWRRSRSGCAAGWRRRRSSTRSSSTAGTCPSRRAATSGPPRRPTSYFETVLPTVPDPLSSRNRRHRRVQPHSRPVKIVPRSR